MEQITEIPGTKHDRQAFVEKITRDWYSTGIEKFPQEVHSLEISFDLGGQTAGMAWWNSNGKFRIQFNPYLLEENFVDFINDTVPHEVAHLIANEFFKEMWPKGCDHGSLWKFVMVKFGKNPERCHNYSCEHLKGKRVVEEFVMEII
jgi:SprT protein